MKPTLTTYGGDLADVGYAGQIVDINPSTIESKTNSAATAIVFGGCVARSSADDTCAAPAAVTDKVIGLAVRHALGIADATSGLVSYAQYASLPILRGGYMYVTAKEDASRGDIAVNVISDNSIGSNSSAAAIAAATSAVKGGGNTGNGTLTLDVTTPVRAVAKQGVYKVRFVVAATNNGSFVVSDPDGFVIGEVVMAAGAGAFDDDIKFAIADGATDFIVGDGFDITVDAGRIPLDGTNGNIKATWETTTAAGSVGIVRVVG